MSKFFSTVFLVFCLCFNSFSQTNKEFKKFYSATMILFTQNPSGGMDMKCTATSFEKTSDGYKLITAAHCLSEEEDGKQVKLKFPIYVTSDDFNEKDFIKAEIEKIGDRKKGFDIGIVSIKTKKEIGVIPIGDESKESDGSKILGVSVPGGLGKSSFHGYIAKLKIDRPLISDNVNFQGVILLQIPASPGASGSSIVSEDQDAIIGVLVGAVFGNAVAIPISRLKNDNPENWIFPELLEFFLEAKDK